MSIGKITQIIGAVIDVEFPSDSIPKVYNALHVTKANLTLEVQQQLGDNIVRAIAMGGSEGLQQVWRLLILVKQSLSQLAQRHLVEL
jgi:F-type H+-transporting ATPase subunit beta